MYFSVIVPVGKKETDIRKTVDSLYDQDMPKDEYEVIVVLDGVNEPVARQLKKYKKAKVYTVDPCGASSARNYGYDKSCGDILLFWDADCTMMPGTLARYKRVLDADPNAAFAYSAYRFNDPQQLHVYHSRPFDPYLLTCMNYISTMSPVRRNVFPRFRDDLKYFQDWDLFLRIVQAGGYGIFVPDTTFVTEVPTRDSISGGNKIPFVDRVNYIKALNGIPRRKLCVTSLGAPLQAIHRAKVLDADYIGAHHGTGLCQLPSQFNLGWDAIYCMGFYPEALENHARLFHNHNGQKLVHWIGTDVHQLYKKPYNFIRGLREQLKTNIDVQMCNAPWLQEELAEVKIHADLVDTPVDIAKYGGPVPALPKEFTVGVYVSDTNKMHNEEFIQDLAKSMPDCRFLMFGRNRRDVYDNIEYVPHQDTLKIIERCSMNLRLTVHDGFPQTPIQFMLMGRNAVTSVPVPFAHQFKEPISKEAWPKQKVALVDMVRKIKRAPGIEVDAVRAHYQVTHSPELYKQKVYSYLKEDK